MEQTELKTNDASQHDHERSGHDIQICTDCIALMRETAAKCRSWSKDTSSHVCKGGLGTSAFVCDSLASSMEACMKLMGAKVNEKPGEKQSCCS